MKVTEEKQDPDLDPCSSGKDPNQNFTDPKQWPGIQVIKGITL